MTSASMFNRITLHVTLPQIQADEFKAVINRWMLMVPTIYFLDICSISHIKTFLSTKSFKDDNHEESIRKLREIDLTHNGVSYLSALMEKASDQRNNLSSGEFVAEARRDWDAMRAFFENARVVESWDFVENYAIDLFGAHPEQSVPAYLAFLQFANDQGLHNAISTKNRLKMAQALCDKAHELGISKSHPIVLVTIACVYGCKDAREVMRFAGNPENFNPGNALGDIQSISRAAGLLTDLVRQAGAEGAHFRNGRFLTADSPLNRMMRYFTMRSVTAMEMPGGAAHIFSLRVDAPSVFPDLFGDDREPLNEKSNVELNKLYELLGVEFPEDGPVGPQPVVSTTD